MLASTSQMSMDLSTNMQLCDTVLEYDRTDSKKKSDGITCIAVDGSTIAAVIGKRNITVWDLSSNSSSPCKEKNHKEDVSDIVMHNGHIIFGSLDHSAQIWSTQSLECTGELLGHVAVVLAVAAENTTIVSGSADKTVRVWDMQSLSCKFVLEGHKRSVHSVSIDSAWIASFDGSCAKVWRTTSIECVQTIPSKYQPREGCHCRVRGLPTAIGENEDQSQGNLPNPDADCTRICCFNSVFFVCGTDEDEMGSCCPALTPGYNPTQTFTTCGLCLYQYQSCYFLDEILEECCWRCDEDACLPVMIGLIFFATVFIFVNIVEPLYCAVCSYPDFTETYTARSVKLAWPNLHMLQKGFHNTVNVQHNLQDTQAATSVPAVTLLHSRASDDIMTITDSGDIVVTRNSNALELANDSDQRLQFGRHCSEPEINAAIKCVASSGKILVAGFSNGTIRTWSLNSVIAEQPKNQNRAYDVNSIIAEHPKNQNRAYEDAIHTSQGEEILCKHMLQNEIMCTHTAYQLSRYCKQHCCSKVGCSENKLSQEQFCVKCQATYVSIYRELGKCKKLDYHRGQKTDVIISYRTSIVEENDDGYGLLLCDALAWELKKANHTPFHGHMVHPGEPWQEIWYGEMPMAKVAIVMFCPSFFKSKACVRELKKICGQSKLQDRVIPIFVGQLDLTANFLGETVEQVKEANYIRASIDGNCLPDPRYGLFQDNWSTNVKDLIKCIADFKASWCVTSSYIMMM